MSLMRLIRRASPIERTGSPIRLNLGCGNMRLDGWVNIDINPQVKPDICCDLLSVRHHFQPSSVDEILLIHSISYLRLWEARIFFKNALAMLKPGGRFVLEFPDAAKCAKHLLENEGERDEYIEAIRGFYAFDLQQIKNKEQYQPYSFGWSARHISDELKTIGFREVISGDPQTHGPRLWRDSRIVATK